jgi:hypothetical protein
VELSKRLAVATGADRAQLELELAAVQQELARPSLADDKLPKNEGRRPDGESRPRQPPKGHGHKDQPKLEVQERFWTLDEADLVARAAVLGSIRGRTKPTTAKRSR